MMPLPFRCLAAVAFGLLVLPALRADVIPHPLFSDHAVLQAGMDVPVWGQAGPGEKVTVEFAGQSVSTTARGGTWMVRLRDLTPGGPHTLTIRGRNTVTIDDVLVGEVWLCSGQSNMERRLGLDPQQKPIEGWEAAAAAATLPTLREFQVAKRLSFTPETRLDGRWVVCTPESVLGFSAVGFFYGTRYPARASRARRPHPQLLGRHARRSLDKRRRPRPHP